MHTIVVVNDFCHVQGGASKVAVDEAVGLARAGHEVIFFGAVGPVCDALAGAPLRTICLDQPELLSVGRHPLVALQGLWNRGAARRMRELLRTLPRERTVVHLHGYTKAMTASPVRAAHEMGFATVCTLHDFFPACPNGAFFNYQRVAPCPLTALSPACIATNCDKRHYAHKAFRVVRGAIQRYGLRFPAVVREYIALSARSAAILAPYLPPAARIIPLENVIDTVAGPPVEAGAQRDLVCVGRLDSEKGVALLADTAARLGLPVRFVGDGPLRARIEAMPGMSVTGWVAADRVQQHLGTARALMFPSLWYETYGLVVSEAASRGVPAVVSDISAAAERVQNGVTGWHFRSGDANDLARCLALLRDDAAVSRAGRAAYDAFWRAPPTHEHHAAELARIYDAVLARAHAGQAAAA